MNRLRLLDKRLSGGGYPMMGELAGLLDVDSKTVQRLMAELRDLYGAVIRFDRQAGGYFYERKPRELENAFGGVQLSEDDRFNVSLGLKAMEFLSLEGAAKGLRRWIMEVSGESLDLPLKELDRMLSLAEVRRAWVVKADIRQLLLAIRGRYTVAFTYHTAYRDTVSEREVDPYHLTYRESAWFLVGYVHDREAVRTFALGRMANVRPLKGRHFADPHFEPDHHFHDGGIIQNGKRVEVHLRISGAGVAWTEERHYAFDHIDPNNPYTRDDEGRLLLKFRHSFLEALVPLILSFGGDVEILKPKALKRLVCAELDRARAVHA